MGQPVEYNYVIKLREEEEIRKDKISKIIKSGYRIYVFTSSLDYCDSRMDIIGKAKIKEIKVKYKNDLVKEDLEGTIFNDLNEFNLWYESLYDDDIITIINFEVIK